MGNPNSPQSPDIEQNSDRGISDFRISGQSLIKKNCHNSRTSNDIDTKFDDDVMSANCYVLYSKNIVSFQYLREFQF